MSEVEGRSEARSEAAAENHAVERRCEMVRENGERCRGTPALGQTFCHAHRRYRETMNGLVATIPLMEDQAAVTFIRSQTVRALALGSIPPANGRAMLEGCRDAERRLDRRLEVQKAGLRYAALAERIGAEKLDGLMGRFVERMEQSAGAGVQGAERASAADEAKTTENPRAAWDALMRQIDEGEEEYREKLRKKREDARRAAMREESGEAGIREQGSGIGEETGSQETGVSERAPEPEAVMHQSVFPKVKEDWDRALARTEGKIAEMVTPREGESWYEVVARKQRQEEAIAKAV